MNEVKLEKTKVTQQSKDIAFRQLVERNQKKAYWVAFDMLASRTEAEDLTQEAFIRVYERWDEFRGESSIDTWYYRILVNMCSNHRKKRGVWKRIKDWLQENPDNQLMQDRFSLFNPEDIIGHNQLSGSINDILETLSEKQRTIFILRYLHDFSIQEIVETTGMASGTIKSHLFRALKTVRKQLTLIQRKGEVK